MFKEVIAIAGSILFSLGGAGAIILGLSSWLGKVWANRILQDERYKHENVMEKLRAQLKQDTDAELQKLKHIHQREIDIMVRKREVYQQLVVSMRVFISGSVNTPEEKKEFLRAYDLCYLWASDEVIKKLGTFLDLMAEHNDKPNAVNQTKLKALYAECLIEIRKDSGFIKSELKLDGYKFVSF